MSNDFKSLRRRVGLGILFIAYLFTAGWVRRLTHDDEFEIGEYAYVSGAGVISQSQRHVGEMNNGTLVYVYYQSIRQVPYAVIVVPLTVLSAVLLLSRPPRVRKLASVQNAVIEMDRNRLSS